MADWREKGMASASALEPPLAPRLFFLLLPVAILSWLLWGAIRTSHYLRKEPAVCAEVARGCRPLTQPTHVTTIGPQKSG